MSTRQLNSAPPYEISSGRPDASPVATPRDHATLVTPQGAAWLASATSHPRSTLALWDTRPAAPVVLPCGTTFDVVSVPALFGRRMVDRLWADGPGSGPVAVHRGRMLLFSAPGTAHRLPSLLAWEEWGPAVPAPLCHGIGDAVTVPPLVGTEVTADPATSGRPGSRWLVAPDTLEPWLPGPEVVLWASVRAARAQAGAAVRVSIFPGADQGANVYDVGRRR
ncbi:bifunctional DNA primase/polymerase [Streptomyces sp. NPDC002851]